MKQFLFILLIVFSFDLRGQDCTEIYLIRHAEKDRSDLKNKNPHLNKLGKDRALKWVEVFKNIQFDKGRQRIELENTFSLPISSGMYFIYSNNQSRPVLIHN